MTQLSSFQPLPLPHPPSHRVPSRYPAPRPNPRPPSRRPAGTTQLTPFPSPAEGNCPTDPLAPSSFLRVPDTGRHSSPPLSVPLLVSHHHVDHADSLARAGYPTTRLPPLSFPAGTRGRFLRRRGAERNGTERNGAARPCRFAEERRACKAIAKSPLWKKNISLSLPHAVSYRTPPTLSSVSLSSFVLYLLRGTPFPLPPPVRSRCVPRPSLSLFLSLLSVLAPFVSDLLFQGLLPFCFCPSRGRDEQCNVIQVQE